MTYTRAPALVRGLDYYRHTAFEFVPKANTETARKRGSQSTLLGGGRYDGLMETLGGPATAGVGLGGGDRAAYNAGGRVGKQNRLLFLSLR